MLSPLCYLAVASALLCWPARSARSRLRRLAPDGGTRWDPRVLRRPGLMATVSAGVLVGWLVAGAGGAAALGLVAATVSVRVRSDRGATARLAASADLVAALGLLTAELRAGVHPAVAAGRVAGDARPAVSEVFESIAGAARLSGDVPGAVRRAANRVPALAEALGRVAAAWQLAEQHGLGLADVLDAVRRDLDHRVKATRRLVAALAGARATSVILAVLPLLGLLLGQAVGAAPWRVLAGTAAGQLLLVAGSGLVCAGTAWSARIVGKAAAP